MARIWSTGFELQSVVAEVEITAITSTPTIDTTIKRTGAASLRANAAGAAKYVTRFFKADSQHAEDVYFRLYVYFTSFPATTSRIAQFGSNSTLSAADGISLQVTSAGKLQIKEEDNQTQIGGDSAVLSTDTWYRVEVACLTDGSVGTAVVNDIIAKVDGTEFVNAAADGGGNANETPNYLFIGVLNAVTMDMYFDDVAINDNTGSAQTSFPGAGSIVHMKPSAAGDNAGGSRGGADSGSDWGQIDEVTPNDLTDYYVLEDANDILDVNCESSSNAGIGSSDTVTLLQIGARHRPATAAGMSYKTRVKSAAAGSVAESAETGHNDITWKTNGDSDPRVYALTSYIDPTTASAWTPTGTNSLDNMQIGIQAIDATPDVWVSTLWALVEFVPAGGGGGSLIKTVDGLAQASVKTVNGLAMASVKTVDGLTNV